MAKTLDQIRTEHPEFSDMSNDDLFEHLHSTYYSKIPRTLVAEKLGYEFPDRGFGGDLKEVGRQAAGGILVDTPRMAAQAVQAFDPDNETAQKVIDYADRNEETFAPDTEGEGFVAGILSSGARALGPSLTAAAGFVGGPEVGIPLTTTLFGGSAYKETSDKVKAAGGSEFDANEAGLKSAAFQGGGESLDMLIGVGPLLKLSKGILATSAKSVGEAIAKETAPDVLKPFAKALGTSFVEQGVSEVAQDIGTKSVEKSYGVDDDQRSYGQVAADALKGTAGLTFFLGLPGLHAHFKHAQLAQEVDAALVDPSFVPKEQRLAIVESLHKGAVDQGVQEADQWLVGAKNDIDNNRPIRRTADLETSDIGEAPTVDDAVEAFKSAAGKWETPTFDIRPNAQKIVANRNVPGVPLQQAIDAQYESASGYVPAEQPWEKPTYDVRLTESIRPDDTRQLSSDNAGGPDRVVAGVVDQQPTGPERNDTTQPTGELTDEIQTSGILRPKTSEARQANEATQSRPVVSETTDTEASRIEFEKLPRGRVDEKLNKRLERAVEGLRSDMSGGTREPSIGDARGNETTNSGAISERVFGDVTDRTSAEGSGVRGGNKQPVETGRNEVRPGRVSDKLRPKEIVKTASGRLTTPFPVFTSKTKSYGKVDKWLLENAAQEAESRGDDFNSRIFRADLESKTIPQASKDSAEEYLFGQQPDVVKPILKDLNNEIQSTVQPVQSNNSVESRDNLEKAVPSANDQTRDIELEQVPKQLVGGDFTADERAEIEAKRGVVKDIKGWARGRFGADRVKGVEFEAAVKTSLKYKPQTKEPSIEKQIDLAKQKEIEGAAVGETISYLKDKRSFEEQKSARSAFLDKHRNQAAFAGSLINNDYEKAIDDIYRSRLSKETALKIFEDARPTGLLGEQTIKKLTAEFSKDRQPTETKSQAKERLLKEIDAALKTAGSTQYKTELTDEDTTRPGEIDTELEAIKDRDNLKSQQLIKERQAIHAKHIDYVTFKIAGTTYRVGNSKERLENFKRLIKAAPLSADVGTPGKSFPARQSVAEFTKDREEANAYYAAELAGIGIGFGYSGVEPGYVFYIDKSPVIISDLIPGSTFVGRHWAGRTDGFQWRVVHNDTGRAVSDDSKTKDAAVANAKERIEKARKKNGDEWLTQQLTRLTTDGSSKNQEQLLKLFKEKNDITDESAPPEPPSGGETRYGIYEQRVVKTGDMEGKVPVVEYVLNKDYGLHDSVKAAKAHYAKLLDKDLTKASDDFAVKHFDQQARNGGYVKVKKIPTDDGGSELSKKDLKTDQLAPTGQLERTELYDKSDISRELAYRAYSGISMTPERRAEQEQDGYAEHMQSILDKVEKYRTTDVASATIDEAFLRYKAGYIEKVNAHLRAKSNVLSPMITGPANFPTRRNEKANNTEHRRLTELLEWDEKARQRLIATAMATRSSDEIFDERMSSILERIKSSLDTIKGIDDGTVRGSSRPLFVNSVVGSIKTFARNGETNIVNKALDFITEYQKDLPKPLITLKNSVWALRDAVKEIESAPVKTGSDVVATYKGATIVNNHDAQRVQILFDSKPSPEVRDKLKKNAFKWSPSNSAWQRQNTPNGIAAARNVLNGLYDTDTELLSQSTGTNTGSTVESIESIVPKRAKQVVSVVQTLRDVPDKAESFYTISGIEGFYDPKSDKLYLIADKLTPETALPVLQHELLHRAELTDPKLKAAMERFEDYTTKRFNLTSKGLGSAIEKAAYKRVIAAEVEPSRQLEEFRAYIVSEYVKAPRSMLEQIGKAIRDFIAAIRMALVRAGLDFGTIGKLTPADLYAMSKYGIRETDRVGTGEFLASSQPARFYSALKRAFISAPDKVFGNAGNIKAWINSNNTVKKDEIYWTGLTDWLDMQTGKVTREDVLSYLDQNGVQVEDVVLKPDDYYVSKGTDGYYELTVNGETKDAVYETYQEAVDAVSEYYSDGGSAKHNNSQLTLPGGIDYRELVVTIPTTEAFNASDSTHFGDVGKGKQIAWIRYNTRIDANGQKVLFLEEIQSQRGQEGRTKGFSGYIDEVGYSVYVDGNKSFTYKNKSEADEQAERALKYNDPDKVKVVKENVKSKVNGVPPAPFVTDSNNKATNAYITLLMKKAISAAIDSGHDAVAWTTGEQQADRYDLSKHIDAIGYYERGDLYNISVWGKGDDESYGPIVYKNESATKDDLEANLGKEITNKIIRGEGRTDGKITYLEDLDLKVGGAWTQAMYGDSSGMNAQGRPALITQAANEIARKMGGRVESTWTKTKTAEGLGRTLSVKGVGDLVNGEYEKYEVVDDSGKRVSKIFSDYDSADNFRYDVLANESRGATQQPALIITPEMRDKVTTEGLPLFSRSVEDIWSEAATMPKTTAQDVAEMFRVKGSKTRSKSKELALSALTQNQLIDIGTQYVPKLKEMGVQRNNYDVEETRWHAKADVLARKWERLIKGSKSSDYLFNKFRWNRNRIEQARLSDMMHMMTSTGIDPRKPRPQEVSNLMDRTGVERDEALGQFNDLKHKYDLLSSDTKKLLDDVDKFHGDVLASLVDTLTGRIETAEMPEESKQKLIDDIKEKFQIKSGPYFPLMRFGTYWVNYGEGVQFFESKREQEQFVKKLTEEGTRVLGYGKSLKNFNKVEGVDPTFIDSVTGLIDELDVENAEALKDGIFQLYLSSLPEQSMRKRFIHRKTTPGWETDALRSFSKKAFHDGKQLAKLKYAPAIRKVLQDADEIIKIGNSELQQKRLDRQIELTRDVLDKLDNGVEYSTLKYDDAEDQALIRRFSRFTDEIDREKAMSDYLAERLDVKMSVDLYKEQDDPSETAADIVKALHTSYDNMMNPDSNQLTNLINQTVFTYMLGFNPSSAVVNYFQTPGVAVPLISGKHGFFATNKEFVRSVKVYFANNGPDGHSIEQGLVTQGERDMYAALTNNGTFDRTRSHDLAGFSEEGVARGTIHRTFMNMATYMFHSAEVANREITALMAYRMEFKKTGDVKKSIEYSNEIVKNAHLDYSSSNRPDLFHGNAARVMLQFKMYSQGMTYIWGKTAYDALKAEGVKKAEARKTLLAFIGVQVAAAGVLSLPIGGILMGAQLVANMIDDNDDPIDIQKEIRDALGEVMSDGLLSPATGADVASRLNLSDLWIREPDRELEGKDKAYYLLKTILGPAASIVENVFVGLGMVGDGNTQRGVETMMPNSIKDVAKAYRFIEEGGATTITGNLIYETNAWEKALQAAGFRPYGYTKQMRENSDYYNAQSAVTKARTRLIGDIAKAEMKGKSTTELEQQRKDWNKKYPTLKITRMSIIKSKRIRKANAEKAKNGVVVKKNYEFLLE